MQKPTFLPLSKARERDDQIRPPDEKADTFSQQRGYLYDESGYCRLLFPLMWEFKLDLSASVALVMSNSTSLG